MYNTAFKRTYKDILEVQLDAIKWIADDIKHNLGGSLDEIFDHVSLFVDIEEEEDYLRINLGHVYGFIPYSVEEEVWFDMTEAEINGTDYNHLKDELRIAEDTGVLEDWNYDWEYEEDMRDSKPYTVSYESIKGDAFLDWYTAK